MFDCSPYFQIIREYLENHIHPLVLGQVPAGNRVRLAHNVRAMLDRQRIQLHDGICAICREPTDNFIQDGCNSGCQYFCHADCAARWILTRFDHPHPYCMICGVNHIMNQIHHIVGDHDLIETARYMAQNGLLVIDPMGPQLRGYLLLRNIDPQDLFPPQAGVLQNLYNQILEMSASARGG